MGSGWTILVHGDGDGVVSGSLAYRALGRGSRVFFTHPAGLAGDLGVVEKGDVFIADVALPSHGWRRIITRLAMLARRGSRIIYVDHHPLPGDFDRDLFPGQLVHDECCSASELTYRFFQEKGFIGGSDPRAVERLAVFGAITDYLDETSWVRERLSLWDKRMVYFEAGLLSEALEGSRRMYDFKRELVRILSDGIRPSAYSPLVIRALYMASLEEELRLYVERNALSLRCIGVVRDPPGSVPRAAVYVMGCTGKPVGVAVEKRRGKAVMSLRTNRRDIDLHSILEEIVGGVGGVSGGHRNAAGARVPLRTLSFFLDQLDKKVCSAIDDKRG